MSRAKRSDTAKNLEHFSVDLAAGRARRQYGDRCGRSRSLSRSDGGDPEAIPNTQNGEATQRKSLKNALMNKPALRGFYKIEQRAHPGRCRAGLACQFRQARFRLIQRQAGFIENSIRRA